MKLIKPMIGKTVAPPWPSWASVNLTDQYIEVHPNVVYPLFLYPIIGKDITQISQYLLEVARRCIVSYLRDVSEGPIKIRFLRDPQWALKNFPPGKVPCNGGEVFQSAQTAQDRGSAEFRRYYGVIIDHISHTE